MKFRNLLFMSTLLATGLSANAAVTQRQKPVPEKASFGYDLAMYMYNPGAKGFFLGANDYSTRASFGDKGYKVWFSKHLGADGTWDNKSVIIKDSVETKKKILMFWAAKDGDAWVDWNNQADTLWTLAPQADNVYRIQMNEGNADYQSWVANADSTYLGAKADGSTTKLYWNLPTSENVDWYFVSDGGYKDYLAKMDVYNAAQELYEQILIANGKNVDVSAQEAIYSNESSTIEELNAATEAVKKAISKAAEENTTADNPVDQTGFITNASYDNNKNDGWKGDAPAFQSYTDAEFYNKNYNYYQIVKGLPKGVYAVTVQAFYRAGSSSDSYTNYVNGTEKNAKLFAAADGDTVNVAIVNPIAEAVDAKLGVGAESEVKKSDGSTIYIPNNMEAAENYFKQDKYHNQLFFAVEGDSAIIGLNKTRTVGSDWTLFDNWGLKYYGKGTDAYTMWMKDMVAQTPDFSSLSSDTYVTTSMVTDYNTKKAGYTSASSKAEVMTAYNDLQAAADSINENISLWKTYVAAIDKANKQVLQDENVDQNNDYVTDLGDYVEGEAPEKLSAKAMTNEELRTEIAKLNKMIKDAIDNAITAGTDVTEKYLVNADFEAKNGWTSQHASGGNVNYGGNSKNHCFEAWNNSNFDVYQEVSDAPVGVYTISVAGFYRYGRNNALTDYKAGKAPTDVVSIYVNDNTAHFKNVFDEHVSYKGNHTGDLYTWDADKNAGGNCVVDSVADGTPDASWYWYPNGMSNAATAFKNGLYRVESYGVVAKKGDKLRIGVRGASNQLGDSWAIWDDFKMVFQGTKADVVKPLLEAKITEMTDTLASKTLVYGSEVKATATKDLETANTNVAGTDGAKMFSSLSTLIEDLASIKSSKLVFDTLETKKEDLYAAMAKYTNASSEAIATASSLYDEVSAATGLTTAEAKAYFSKIDAALAALRLPSNYKDATKDNPVDMTSMVINPGFEDAGANSFTGWTGPGYNFGNDDTQKSALLIEYYNKTFNLYQTISGLPDGFYKVGVKAFYRFGSSQEDMDKYQADKNTKGNAYMYAVCGTDSVKEAVALLASGAVANETGLGYGSESHPTVGDVKYSEPNDMVSAHGYFVDGYYQNYLLVEVKGGELTIGLAKDKNVGNDWVILDDWTLSYLGTVNPVGIKGVNADNAMGRIVATEVYNLSGARVNGLQKGVNIVKFTDAQGNTSVRKIIVK